MYIYIHFSRNLPTIFLDINPRESKINKKVIRLDGEGLLCCLKVIVVGILFFLFSVLLVAVMSAFERFAL